jgi:hypothetical protein
MMIEISTVSHRDCPSAGDALENGLCVFARDEIFRDGILLLPVGLDHELLVAAAECVERLGHVQVQVLVQRTKSGADPVMTDVASIVDDFGWLYHGTCLGSIASIHANGLSTRTGRHLEWVSSGRPPAHVEDFAGRIFFSTTQDAAMAHAWNRASAVDDDAIVLRVPMASVGPTASYVDGTQSDRVATVDVPSNDMQVWIDDGWTDLPSLIRALDLDPGRVHPLPAP